MIAAEILTFSDGRPQSSISKTTVGSLAFDSYHYDGERLVVIDSVTENDQGDDRVARTFDIEYDAHGSVALIVDRASGQTVFRAHLQNVRAVEDAFVDRMMAVVPQWVTNLEIDAAVDALVLGYDVNEHTLLTETSSRRNGTSICSSSSMTLSVDRPGAASGSAVTFGLTPMTS